MTEEKQAISDRREKWKIYNIHRPCPVCRWHKCEKSCQRFKVEPNKIRKWWDEIDYINACNPKSVDLKELVDPLKTKILKKSCKKRYVAVAVESFQCLANLLWLKPCMMFRLLIIQLVKARLLLEEDGFRSSWAYGLFFSCVLLSSHFLSMVFD